MQKYENLVDLEKPEKMSIWSLSELSIQPRTSPSKFGGDFISSFIRLLTGLSQLRSAQALWVSCGECMFVDKERFENCILAGRMNRAVANG